MVNGRLTAFNDQGGTQGGDFQSRKLASGSCVAGGDARRASPRIETGCELLYSPATHPASCSFRTSHPRGGGRLSRAKRRHARELGGGGRRAAVRLFRQRTCPIPGCRLGRVSTGLARLQSAVLKVLRVDTRQRPPRIETSMTIEPEFESLAPSTLSGFLTRQEAAAYLGRSPGTLANWARQRSGPPFYRPEDGTARYFAPDLVAYRKSRSKPSVDL